MLTSREKALLIQTAREETDKPVWVGVGGDTASAVREAKTAAKLGAKGVMISPPSFFRCTAKGYMEHVAKIAETGLDIMLYNAPSRCGYALWQNVVEKLAEQGVSLKDAGGDIAYAEKLAAKLPLLCGNEQKLGEFVKVGACGVVSVVANVAPKLTRQVSESYVEKYRLTACGCATDNVTAIDDGKNMTEKTFGKDVENIYKTLVRLAFCEISPIPVKYMLAKLGVFATAEMRLPLTEATDDTKKAIDEFFAKNEESAN